MWIIFLFLIRNGVDNVCFWVWVVGWDGVFMMVFLGVGVFICCDDVIDNGMVYDVVDGEVVY